MGMVPTQEALDKHVEPSNYRVKLRKYTRHMYVSASFTSNWKERITCCVNSSDGAQRALLCQQHCECLFGNNLKGSPNHQKALLLIFQIPNNNCFVGKIQF